MDFRSFAKGPVQLARDFRPEKQFLSLKAVGGEGLTRKFRRVDRKSSEADHIALNLDNFMAFVRFIGALSPGPAETPREVAESFAVETRACRPARRRQ